MRRWVITFIAGSLLLAACGSGGADLVEPAGGVFGYSNQGGRDVSAAGEDGSETPEAPGSEDADGRKVIRTARLELNADDTRSAYRAIGEIVERSGGFIARAEVGRVESEEAQPTITMTVRVPSNRLSGILDEIKGVATRVVTESQNSQDVSEQFVDLEARLTNLEALETELRALLAEVRAQPDADPEKLLRVFNELASVRGQIEQIEGQLQHLSELTDLASVEIAVTQTPAVAPIVDQPWAPAEAFRSAARSLVQAFQGLADGLITFAVFILPVVLAIGIVPAAIGWWLWRRYRRRPAAATPATD